MKNTNISEWRIGMVIMIIFTLCWIISVYILVNIAHPEIKHRIFVSGITIGCVAFMLLLGLRFLHHKAPLFRFSSLCNGSKLFYSIIYLALSVGFIGCVEYLIYQYDKDQFSIEQRYFDKSIQDREESITTELEIYQYYRNKYEQLASTVSPTKDYDCQKVNNKIITLIDGDTLIIHLHRTSPMTPKSHIRHKKDEIDYYGVRSIGISTPDESCNLLHSSSRKALNSMKLNGYIHGVDLVELINEKKQFYNQHCVKYKELLAGNQVITFWAFLIYSFFNYSSIANGPNVIIRILVLLQTIIITFLSGYIYKTLYKIMDGE